MREIKLTQKTLDELKPEQVIYAEYAGIGARGAEGSARIYALQDGKMKFYVVRAGDAEEGLLDKAVWFLNDAVQKDILLIADAGYGNHALKNVEADFRALDSEKAFLYENAGRKYKLQASVPGVYARVVPMFAERAISARQLEDYVESYGDEMEMADEQLFILYGQQLERMEHGRLWFDFSPYDYFNALKYIRNANGLEIVTDRAEWMDAWKAVLKYRLAYAVEILGWDAVTGIFDKLMQENQTEAVLEISNALGEDLGEVFSTLEKWSANDLLAQIEDDVQDEARGLGYSEPQAFLMILRRMFMRPVLVEFTEKQRKGAMEAINAATAEQIVQDCDGLAKFIVNFIAHEDEWSYGEILPMVERVIRILPNYYLKGSRADQLMWIADDVLERVWGDIEEDDAVQKRFRDLMYDLHWPRVGSIWPIVHTGEFALNDKVANTMLTESVNYVLSLNDIAERNKELGELLAREAEGSKQDIGYGIIGENTLGFPTDETGLWRRALEYKVSKMSAKEKFETILKEVAQENWFCYLNYPENTEEADLVLGELVKTGKKARFSGYPRFETLIALLQAPKTIRVGGHILDFVADNFAKLVKLIFKECTELDQAQEELATMIVRAAAKGVTEENELAPLESMAEAAAKLGSDEADLQQAVDYAKMHQKAIAFQREKVTPLFKK